MVYSQSPFTDLMSLFGATPTGGVWTHTPAFLPPSQKLGPRRRTIGAPPRLNRQKVRPGGLELLPVGERDGVMQPFDPWTSQSARLLAQRL